MKESAAAAFSRRRFPSVHAQPNPLVLQLRNLHFRYTGSNFALRVDELAVPAGQRVALVGPSGSGKSTLLALIAGIWAPHPGEIEIGGKRVDQMSSAARSSFRITKLGLVFQSFELVEHLTVLDNILLPYRLHGELRLTPQVRQRARDLAESLGIGNLLARRPTKLSGGEQQRAAIARALVTQPSLVLADEPTGSLDPANKRRVLQLLFDCLEASPERATFLCATHDVTLLSEFDRTIDVAAFSTSSDQLAEAAGEKP